MEKEIKNKSHSKRNNKVILNLFQDLHLIKTKEEEMLKQVQHDGKEIKNKVIPEICSRQSQPYVKTKWLISPTETFGDDGVRVPGDDGVKTLGDDGMAEGPDNGLRGRRYIKAFTLIEVLVVVLIIGILAAVALPQYQKAVLKSRLTTLIPNVKAISEALDVYYLSNGEYPSNDASLIGIDISGCTIIGEDFYCSDATYDYKESESSHQIGGFLLNFQGLAYLQWPMQDVSPKAGTRECWADSGNTLANQVCQSMGGTANGTSAWRKGNDYKHSHERWNTYSLP